MKTIILTLAIAAAATVCQAATPEVIAHRGYWTTEGSAENSIRALVKADSIGCYGSEFDVWMTSDGVAIINHDDVINGIDIQTSPAYKTLSQTLRNGELVPTLWDYLTTFQGLSTRLIFEMKFHRDKAREEELVKQIVALVNVKGLEDRVEYITFSREGFHNLIKYAPAGTPVYYLTGDMTPAEIKEAGGAGLDYNLGVMMRNPQWTQEAHDLGLKVNVWTVDREEDMRWCIEQGVDFITTNQPELLQRILSE